MHASLVVNCLHLLQSKFWFENGKLMQTQKPINPEDVESKFTRTVEGNKHIIVSFN